MNKKHLSVVMAGAMLASSVAPVLAEVVKEEVSANELGLLQEEVRTLVESARFANESANNQKGKDFRNQSIYAVEINGVPQTKLTADASTKDWQDVFNSLRVGDTVKVIDKGHKEVDGKNYHFEVQSGVRRYTKDSLEKLGVELANLKTTDGVIKDAHLDTLGENLIIEFHDNVNIAGHESEKTMTIKVGDQEIKWQTHPAGQGVTTDGKLPVFYQDEAHKLQVVLSKATKPEEFHGFVLDDTVETDHKEIAASLVKEYTITPGGYNYNVSDLYDGLFLTEKGNDFFGMLKDNVAANRDALVVIKDKKGSTNGIAYHVNNEKAKQEGYEAYVKSVEKTIYNNLTKFNDVYRFEVRLAAKGNLKAETYTISGKDKQEVARLASWMLRPQARVDVLSGSNRYETAAKIAKEYAGLTGDTVKSKGTDWSTNIVLVNGEALVDGLAAAPLAASKENWVANELGQLKAISAPILLTEADELPRATKVYLKEVLKNVEIGKLGKVKVHLVGGESVLNKSLERELKGLGFSVERFGGSNREATSLEVAKEIGFRSNQAFVVGGNGEADAMSIAAVAADQKTPIIVGSNNGLTEDAVYALRNVDTTIVGGKAVVTAADEKALREEAKSVNRVYGANRKATNAKVIENYYNGAGFANGVGKAQNIIVAKDGQNNKMELVDALAAANMAATKKAPIVLATDKLSKEQEAKINSYAKDAYGLFQVGGGVSRDVVKTIARMLNLTNR